MAFSTKKIKAKYYIWLSTKTKRIAFHLPYVSYTERCKQAPISKMILEEKEINKYTLNKIIGEPAKLNLNKPQNIGSRSFFLKSIDFDKTDVQIKVDSKCNFQKYSDGILMRINYSNKLNAIPLSNKNLKKIELTRGKEKITPLPFSIFRLMINLKAPIRYSRYFALRRPIEYEISDTVLKIKSDKYEMTLITNGYDFENQLPFFKSLDIGNKLEITK